jgi:Phage integrase, N-terminal SAM-like domain
MRTRIAPPGMLPEADPLPHLICSQAIFFGGLAVTVRSAWSVAFSAVRIARCNPTTGVPPMTKPMSTLRRHMIEDRTIRNMSPNSQKVYTYAVANFAAFHAKSPDKLGVEHGREYRLHLIARGLRATSINPIIAALRFFYGTTLGRKEMIEHMPYARREDTLPAVLTERGHDRSQVLRLPEAVDDYVGADNPLRFIDSFVDGLDLAAAGFARVAPKATGRPGYAPADLLGSVLE